MSYIIIPAIFIIESQNKVVMLDSSDIILVPVKIPYAVQAVNHSQSMQIIVYDKKLFER